MTIPDWRNSKRPDPSPRTRTAAPGRTDFEDSLLSARRELQAQEVRRSQALAKALRSRTLDSDPGGKIFSAQQKQAIAARRAANARQAAKIARPDDEFSHSLQTAWNDKNSAPTKRDASSVKVKALWVLAIVCALSATAILVVLPGWWHF